MTSTTASTTAAKKTHLDTPRGRRPGGLTVLRWELRKLAAQGRARYTLLGCLLAPALVVLVLNGQQRPPKDNLYGRHIHDSGYAMPLLVLGFAAQWVFPLLTALVAGDIFASEDHHGTWKTVLTRSVSRAQLFWAKTLTSILFALSVLVLFAASTIVTSLLVVGQQPLIGLTGQLIPSGTALPLVIASWATALAPLLGFTALAILLSVLSRNPAVGIVGPVVIGLVMQLVGSLGGLDLVRHGLLTTPFESWHGLFTATRFYDLITEGLLVSAGWLAICLAIAYTALRRRDITGG
jgi:ABC-2 type transport system permease protein